MAFQIPLILTVQAAARILGPALMKKYNALYKNLKKANRTNKTWPRFLTDKVKQNHRKKLNEVMEKSSNTNQRYRRELEQKDYKIHEAHKYEPQGPPSMAKAAKQVEASNKKKQLEKNLSKKSTAELRAMNERLIRRAIRERKKNK